MVLNLDAYASLNYKLSRGGEGRERGWLSSSGITAKFNIFIRPSTLDFTPNISFTETAVYFSVHAIFFRSYLDNLRYKQR